MENKMNGAGNVSGFQISPSFKERKAKIDEFLAGNKDLNGLHVVLYLSSLDPDETDVVAKQLDDGDFESMAGNVKSHIAREVVKKKMGEVVRKKPGGGGFVLYSPNKGKKGPAKSVGHFPTKLAAKKAELARFPPKDPGKLTRLRKSIDRLLKNPQKAASAEKTAEKQKDSKAPKNSKSQKESLDILRVVVGKFIRESLFREEKTGSEWDAHIQNISKGALASDQKFQTLQRNIEKKTEAVLKKALSEIQKSVKGVAKISGSDVKHNPEKGKTYLMFSADIGEVEIGPIYIYTENGIPKIEVSDNAKNSMVKVEPEKNKKFRAELITVQERVLDHVEDLVVAIGKRDKYLTSIEIQVDDIVNDLSPLQISLLKKLLVKKYRKD